MHKKEFTFNWLGYVPNLTWSQFSIIGFDAMSRYASTAVELCILNCKLGASRVTETHSLQGKYPYLVTSSNDDAIRQIVQHDASVHVPENENRILYVIYVKCREGNDISRQS